MIIEGYQLPTIGDIGTLLIGIGALATFWQAWQAKRLILNKVDTVATKVDEVQKQTNGMSHVMQEIARKEGRQEKADEMIAESAARKDAVRNEAIKDAQSAADVANIKGV
jgi:hypothetical protein